MIRQHWPAAGRLRNRSRLAPFDDFGGALIEAALAMPVLVLVLVGAAEFGRLAYFAIEVSSAAYSGATYASQNQSTAANTTNIASAAIQDAANVPGLSATSSVACYCNNGTTNPTITCSSAATDCVSPSRISQYVQVNTSASVSPIFNYPAISNTWTLHGSATMRIQQ